MINTDKTVAPGHLPNTAGAAGKINTADTVPPEGGSAQESAGGKLLPGTAVGDGYILMEPLPGGSQSDVYLAKKDGESFVAKIYRSGWHPTAKMKDYLLHVSHPNIAPVLACGDCGGSYYEIYRYYSEGTPESDLPLTASHLSSVVIPSVNEGLNELHKNGIIHCDIKPGNLFYTAGKKSVLIGDCGISGFVNAEGRMVDALRGTPEYAPPVRSVMWTAEYTPAYDYGAFGLVLCRLLLGRSLLAGLSHKEIAAAWTEGIRLPPQINGRIESLIRGLLQYEEEKRWTYHDVKRWCEGEYVPPEGRGFDIRRPKKKIIVPLVFGMFGGDVIRVNSLHALAKQMRAHWEQACVVIKKTALLDFLRQFDEEHAGLSAQARELARYGSAEAAVFKLLCLLDPDADGFCYRGYTYANVADFIGRLQEGDADAEEFLASGLLIYYLRAQNADRVQVDKLEQIIKNEGTENTAAIATVCYAIQNKTTIEVFGRQVRDMNGLADAFSGHSAEEISALIETDAFYAWLFGCGFEEEAKQLKEMGDD